ncbi:unnamed protein product [Cylicocyclus nassatus]|uniref:Uncharacterized protein n=1 Tax=Cylicocyclus nassatus TaxID=53992 RepID=A0AA36GXE1_CYLNA|nr:unnamed protein product [Cylicocyclus nassatus]
MYDRAPSFVGWRKENYFGFIVYNKRSPNYQEIMKVCPHHGVVARLAERGESTAAMPRKLHTPSRTVQKTIKQWKEKGNVALKPKTNRPRTVRQGQPERHREKPEHSTFVGPSIMKDELGLRSHQMLTGHQLTSAGEASRLEKCRKLLEFFEVRRLEDVLLTDEEMFATEGCWNPQNDRQLFSPKVKKSRKRKITKKSLFLPVRWSGQKSQQIGRRRLFSCRKMSTSTPLCTKMKFQKSPFVEKKSSTNDIPARLGTGAFSDFDTKVFFS